VQAVDCGPCNSNSLGKADTVTNVDPVIIALYTATILLKFFK